MEDNEAKINAVVDIGICGNNIIEDDEDCEDLDLGNHTCTDLGFSGGILSCDISCSFDTSMCFGAPTRSFGPVGSPANPDDDIVPLTAPLDFSLMRSFDISAMGAPMSRFAPAISRYESSDQSASLITSTTVRLFHPIDIKEARSDRCSCAIVLFF